MKFVGGIALFVSLMAMPQPSLAMDCKKAKTELERFICSDAEMKKADAQLNTSYSALLAKVKDQEFRAAISRSQKRWLEERDSGKYGEGKVGRDGTKGSHYGEDAKKFILDVSAKRKEFLDSNGLIAPLQAQREIRRKDGQGAYAGYKTDCSFIYQSFDGEYIYECFGTIRRQTGNRVCATEGSWATGHDLLYGTVSEVVDGKLVGRASCEGLTAGDTCPSERGKPLGSWQIGSKGIDKSSLEIEGFLKHDLEEISALGPEELSWMDECVTAKVYPQAAE